MIFLRDKIKESLLVYNNIKINFNKTSRIFLIPRECLTNDKNESQKSHKNITISQQVLYKFFCRLPVNSKITKAAKIGQ